MANFSAAWELPADTSPCWCWLHALVVSRFPVYFNAQVARFLKRGLFLRRRARLLAGALRIRTLDTDVGRTAGMNLEETTSVSIPQESPRNLHGLTHTRQRTRMLADPGANLHTNEPSPAQLGFFPRNLKVLKRKIEGIKPVVGPVGVLHAASRVPRRTS